ncbi:ABC transporter family substrate-binding protein [Actinokineospora sp. 24-640]
MRTRRKAALGGALLAALLVVTGCVSGGSDHGAHSGDGAQTDHGAHSGHGDYAAGSGTGGGSPMADMPAPSGAGRDINPQPGSALREGGELRLAVDALPSNFNPKHVDGAQPVTQQIAEAILPSAFVDGPDGVPVPNKDFFDRIELESTSPQVVRYTIAPAAVWTNGRVMTWEDLRAHWAALNGSDAGFETTGRVGYEDVASVERGATDKEAVVTFREPFADWPALFGPLVPLELTQSPDAFNSAWAHGPTTSAGPFEIDLINATEQTIVVRRNDNWWKIRPPLDSITFRVVPPAARADELAGGGIDLFPIGGDAELLTRAKAIPDAQVRQASERRVGQLTFNGAKGAPLSDQRLRAAIAQAVDPQAITDAVVGPIVPGAKAVGNHVLPPGHAGYKDNAPTLPHDPNAARAALDALGWKPDGAVRVKGGKRLSLRLVVAATPAGQTVGDLVARQLLAVGVEAKTEAVPTERVHDTHLASGAFDLIAFERTTSPYPLSHDRQAFEKPTGANFGRVVIPGATAIYDRATAELDPAQRTGLADQIDVLAWKHAHHLPLYPGVGVYAVRANLANFGAPGLASLGFATAGFLK